MKNSAKRSILRWIHLIAVIPILGCIYAKPADFEKYAGFTQQVFVPLIILTGYWMYGGFILAILGVGFWLASIKLFGYPAALLPQIVLLAGRRIWLMMRGRRAMRTNVPPTQE